MRINLLIILTTLFVVSKAQDKIVLKNGERMYGTIVSYEADGSLVLKRDNEELKLVSSEISKIKWQKLASAPSFKNKGYFNETSMGFMLGNNQYSSLTGNFSMLMNQGIILKERVGLGVSVGCETWNDALRFPAIFNARYYFGKDEFQPYFAIRGGYMVTGRIKHEQQIDPWWSTIPDNSHGPTGGFQLGMRKSLDKSFGLSGSLGFRYQKFIRDTGWGGINYTDMYRIEAKIGLFFN